MNRKILSAIVLYLAIGISFFLTGYIPAPFSEQVSTFLFIVLLWPVVVMAHVLDLLLGSPLN